jgi:hypothetical protein
LTKLLQKQILLNKSYISLAVFNLFNFHFSLLAHIISSQNKVQVIVKQEKHNVFLPMSDHQPPTTNHQPPTTSGVREGDLVFASIKDGAIWCSPPTTNHLWWTGVRRRRSQRWLVVAIPKVVGGGVKR